MYAIRSYYVHDGQRDLVLNGEDIIQIPVVSLRPQVMPAGRIDKLRNNFV